MTELGLDGDRNVDLGTEPRGLGRLWRLARRRPFVLVALGLLIVIYLVVFLGPLVYRASPVATNPLEVDLGPSIQFPLGTDELGRDELARVLSGGQVSLITGVLATVVALAIGAILPTLAAIRRGFVEVFLMRLIDMFMAIPPFFLVLVMVATLGTSPPVIVVVIGISYWPQVARVIYSEVVVLRDSLFIEAARASGSGYARIVFRHVIPQIVPTILVFGTLAVGWSILTESALSFVGLGIQPPLASWGSMLQDAQVYTFLDPQLAIYPGAAILLSVLCFNIVGNAARDLLN